jgi:hypothetical protein
MQSSSRARRVAGRIAGTANIPTGSRAAAALACPANLSARNPIHHHLAFQDTL